MPQFIMTLYFDQNAGDSPPDLDAIMARIDTFNDHLRDKGAFVMTAGLEPSPKAQVVRADESGASSDDGPYLPTGEQAGGFWIIKSDCMGNAVVWAERASRILGLPVEVRALIN